MAILSSIENSKKCNGTRLPRKMTMGRDICKGKSTIRKPRELCSGARRSISVDAAHVLFHLAQNNCMPHSTDLKSLSSKKKVSFNPMASVVAVPKTTREEAHLSWYGSDEYRTFEFDRRNAIAAIQWALENAQSLDSEHYTSLGLEKHLSRHAMYERKYRLMRHVHYVLEQQHYHRCSGGHIESVLGLSERFSSESDLNQIVNEDTRLGPQNISMAMSGDVYLQSITHQMEKV